MMREALDLMPAEHAAYLEVRRARDLQQAAMAVEGPETSEGILTRLRRASEEVWLDHEGNPEMETIQQIRSTLARTRTNADSEPTYFC